MKLKLEKLMPDTLINQGCQTENVNGLRLELCGCAPLDILYLTTTNTEKS